MSVSLGYVTRETATNLWRNRLMALAAILTVGVSLSLVGTALLLRQAVNNQLSILNANVNLQVFMKASASTAETNAIRTVITGTHEIKSYKYLDHQQSYDQAVRLFKAADETTAISALTPATTPPVFQCTLVHPGDAAAVARDFNGQAGVYHVEYPAKSIHDLEALSNVLQIVLLVLAIVLLVSA